jgi:hypothetical protein
MQIFDDYLKTPLDLNNINYLRLAPYSSKYYHPKFIEYILLKINNERHRIFHFCRAFFFNFGFDV